MRRGVVEHAKRLRLLLAASSTSAADFNEVHNCDRTEPTDPRDAALTGKPDALAYEDGVDLVLPEPVLDWMSERRWQASHDGWHNIRRCDSSSSF